MSKYSRTQFEWDLHLGHINTGLLGQSFKYSPKSPRGQDQYQVGAIYIQGILGSRGAWAHRSRSNQREDNWEKEIRRKDGKIRTYLPLFRNTVSHLGSGSGRKRLSTAQGVKKAFTTATSINTYQPYRLVYICVYAFHVIFTGI